MKSVMVFCAVSLAVVVGAASQAFGQLTLYDNFNAATINPEKWSGSEGIVGSAAPSTESRRQITAKQLELRLTSWGGTESNGGTLGASSLRLSVADSTAVQAKTLQAAVKIASAAVQACSGNAYATNARARIFGAFFNDGSSTGASDRTGDIRATFEKVRDTSGADVIKAFLSRCSDADCNTTTVPLSHTFTTGWTEGKADKLKLQWVPARDKFVFTVNPGPKNETYTLSYKGFYTDADPAVYGFRQLSVHNYVANCTSDRKSASIRATFDNVYTAP